MDRLHPPGLAALLARASTDGTGTCALGSVPPGSWVLLVEASGFARRFEDLRFAEGQALAPVRVVLLRGCSLAGTVFTSAASFCAVTMTVGSVTVGGVVPCANADPVAVSSQRASIDERTRRCGIW